jgi:prepilin peptidase CpaA
MALVSWVVVLVIGLLGAWSDIRERRIPNALTFPVFLGGLLWNGYQGGWTGAGGALWAAVLLALPFILLFVAGVGGAGDAKMMGALGAWLRLPHGYFLLVGVTLSGAVLGVAYSLLRGRGKAAGKNLSSMALWLPHVLLGAGRMRDRTGIWPAEQAMTRMPYGVAIFVGSCLALGGVWLWGR